MTLLDLLRRQKVAVEVAGDVLSAQCPAQPRTPKRETWAGSCRASHHLKHYIGGNILNSTLALAADLPPRSETSLIADPLETGFS
jgi:hypothetical protein